MYTRGGRSSSVEGWEDRMLAAERTIRSADGSRVEKRIARGTVIRLAGLLHCLAQHGLSVGLLSPSRAVSLRLGQGRLEIGIEVEHNAGRGISRPVQLRIDRHNTNIGVSVVWIRSGMVVYLADYLDRNQIPMTG